MEKQGRGRGKRDNYNLGRFDSQAEKQGGSSSCPIWELGLSQKPSPTTQPPQEADPTLPFHLGARPRASSFTDACICSFMKCWLCTCCIPRAVWSLGIQTGRGTGACGLVVTRVLSVRLLRLQSWLHHLVTVPCFVRRLSFLCLTFLV